MYAVGRLGNYITRGVYTVSGPFHPFGGAVDIVVVEQPDGSFKSSPWYVRFGKFQGVLKAKEKVVKINVNGDQADFNMYLDHKGEAFFLREVEGDEGDSVIYPLSSGEETDGQSLDRMPRKSKSYNYDASESDLVTEIDVTNGKVLTRTNSRGARILGLVFGRKSMKENRVREEEDDPVVVRADSLERAEIAADLLEMRWSTNLALGKQQQDGSRLSASDISGGEAGNNLPLAEMSLSFENEMVNGLENSLFHEEFGFENSGICSSSRLGFQKLGSSDKDFGVEMSCFNTAYRTSNLVETCLQESYDLNSQSLSGIYESGVTNADHDDADTSELRECSSKKLDEEKQQNENVILLPGKLHETAAELISEVKSVQEYSTLVTKEESNIPECLADESDAACFNDTRIIGSDGASSNSFVNGILTETYTQMVTVDSLSGLVEEVESCSIRTISGFNSSVCEVQDRERMRDEVKVSACQHSLEPVDNFQELREDTISAEAANVSSSEGSQEDQLLFGDLDDLSPGEAKCGESRSSNHAEEENNTSVNAKNNEAVNQNVESFSEKFVLETAQNGVEESRKKSKIVSRHINIPLSSKASGDETGRMAESLPNMQSPIDGLITHNLLHSLGHSLDSSSESSTWIPLREDSDRGKENQISKSQPTVEDAQVSEQLKGLPANLAVGDPSKVIDGSNGKWRVWPFSLRRSRSMKSNQPARSSSRSSDAENIMETSTVADGQKDMNKSKVKEKKVRAMTPTPEQLASLNLKEGKNTVTFTFSTSMLGQQQVDARIYLWKWDTRVVISDVDGTITKSDVLGQFMPLVGMDWSQTGVAHLFSAIKENGYQLLFLSARAISQAYHTRQFLFNLKQDGKALPDGPVLISPDGLFPSLFREVIRRAPHEFKIGCLEDVRALFPADRNPFYAGFGNRDTDELSYLKVGIPKGKIFTINPKGEVAVHRRVDTKSYTSLHSLVHDMFPPMSSSEQEDFNSWNFWRLPPPAIDG